MNEWEDQNNLAAFFTPGALADLGYGGPTTFLGRTGEGDNVQFQNQIAPEFAQWLAQNGYRLSGTMAPGNGNAVANILSSSGAPVRSAGYSDGGGIFDYLPAIGSAAVLGAGAYGLAGAGASAGVPIGNGAFLGEGIASGIPAWDAAAGIGAGGAAGAGTVGPGIAGSLGGASGAGGSAIGSAGGNVLGQLGAAGGAGMGWADLVGGLLGSGAQIYGANQAADSMGEATKQANDLQKYMYDTTRGDNMPALAARNSGLEMMRSLLADPSTITKDPGYQFGLSEGTKTLNNGAAARGMTYSGAQGKALQRYGQDYAGTKLDQSFNRLSALASGGQPGAGTIASAGANYGNTVGNNITNQGNVNAMPYIVGGNALGNTINGLTAYGSRNGWWGKP